MVGTYFFNCRYISYGHYCEKKSQSIRQGQGKYEVGVTKNPGGGYTSLFVVTTTVVNNKLKKLTYFFVLFGYKKNELIQYFFN